MRLTAIALALILVSSTASAQSGGHIGLYSDSPGYSDCFLAEAVYATNSIYVVHTLIAEARSARFRVVHNWHGPIVGEVDYVGNLHLGDIYTGVTITYVGCKALPHLLARLDFTPVAPTPPCTAFFFAIPEPFADQGQIAVTDCEDNTLYASSSHIVVNGPDDCGCLLHLGPWPDWVRTETTSWGTVKALYQ